MAVINSAAWKRAFDAIVVTRSMFLIRYRHGSSGFIALLVLSVMPIAFSGS
jgi:hypothetical protein